MTDAELKAFRDVLGTANWIVGSTRPDIAVLTAQLQQRVSRANVSDLVEANKLVSTIRDFSHVKIVYKILKMFIRVFPLNMRFLFRLLMLVGVTPKL